MSTVIKLCYQCLLKEGLKVQQPQMLKLYKGCDGCERTYISTWSKSAVEEQLKVLAK